MFVKTYHYCSLKKNSDDIEHILVSSFAVGFVICKIFYTIPIGINYVIDHVFISVLSVLFGYIISKLKGSKFIQFVFSKLKICDTGNTYLWDDLIDADYAMKAIVTYDDCSYYGYVHLFESYSNTPQLVLCAYTKKSGKKIKDYSSDPNRIIVLDTSTAKSVEIIYAPESSMTKDIIPLCKRPAK